MFEVHEEIEADVWAGYEDYRDYIEVVLAAEGEDE